MKNVIVTGGLGYIGSHTVVELINSGYNPIIIDDLSNSSEEVLDGIEAITNIRPKFIEFDLSDTSKTTQFFSEVKEIVGLIHFAAFKAVGESIEKPVSYYQNNLGSLINILNEFKTTSFDNIIFSSSCTVYGEADQMPITESSPIKKAKSPYGNTKIICEQILEDYTIAYKKKAIALRYFNPIGAHSSAEIGELPKGVPQNLVPFITQSAAGIRGSLSVFGNDYNTADGSCIRDYIHVVDLAKAHVIALDRLVSDQQKENYEVFNLGTGKGTSVLEMITAFEKATEKKIDYKIVQRREGDVVEAYADTRKVEKYLNWKAQSSLEKALKSAWEWEKKIRNNR